MSWRIEHSLSTEPGVSFSNIELQWFVPRNKNPLQLLTSPTTLQAQKRSHSTIYCLHYPFRSFSHNELSHLLNLSLGHPHAFGGSELTNEGIIADLRLPKEAQKKKKEALRLMKLHVKFLGKPFAEFVRDHADPIERALYSPDFQIESKIREVGRNTFTSTRAREILLEEMKNGPIGEHERRLELLAEQDQSVNNCLSVYKNSLDLNDLRTLVLDMPIQILSDFFWYTSDDRVKTVVSDFFSKPYGSTYKRHVINTQQGPHRETKPFPYDDLLSETFEYFADGKARFSIGDSFVEMKEFEGKFIKTREFIDSPKKHALLPALVWKKGPLGRTFLTSSRDHPASFHLPTNTNTVLGLAAAVAMSKDFHLTLPKEGKLGHSRNQNIFEAQIGVTLLDRSTQILDELPLFDGLEKFVDSRIHVS